MFLRSAAAFAALLLALPTPAANAFAIPSGPATSLPGTPRHPRSPELAVTAARAGLRPAVLELALAAHARALSAGETASPVVTVIDYSLPSRERRFWVLDLDRGAVLAHELVAHGRNTGDDDARRFSNRNGSNQSSLGTFLTGATYHGKHGLSLRLRGLDGTLNDQAEARAIVVHGAAYVSERIVAQLGRLGRSQGCPALSPEAAPRIIELIRGGTVLYAHYAAPSIGAGPTAE